MLTSKHSFDYYPLIKRLVLRTAEEIHELFLHNVCENVTAQLSLLSVDSGSTAEFAKGVKIAGSGSITPIDPEHDTHCPDTSFRHKKSPLATVIFEVAYTQTGKKLETLADDYLLGSDLEVRVMVGFDIEFKKKELSSLSGAQIKTARVFGPRKIQQAIR